MPQGRGAKSKKPATREPKTEPAEHVEETQPEKPVDGVLIQNKPSEEGGVTRHIQALGTVTINELPTLLRLAAKDVEKGLGLE